MTFGGSTHSGLLKEQLAAKLRDEIIHGRLEPGATIVENRWAKHFGVGQTSIREAINILASEGFVDKPSGRSARVTEFSLEDIDQIQLLRAGLEAIAVRLLTVNQPDLSDLEQAYADMAAAAQCGNMRTLIDRDLCFHLLIFEKTGNRFLFEAARRVLVPLFAFTLVKALAKNAGPQSFLDGLEDHARMLDVIRAGNPRKAEQYTHAAMKRFAELGRAAFVERPTPLTPRVR